MSEPKVEIVPMKGAAMSDRGTTLDVLVRITPPAPEVHFVRPAINLGLVLDRSGSMAGARKMDYSREAATFAVQQLLPTDRVSVTIFDNQVETIVPNASAVDKLRIFEQIRGIVPRGATALHAGWKEGGGQVERNLIADGLNRVILLSDGLANEGVTDPNVIAAEARALAARGVGTTTMGLGDDYNEDLMQQLGEAGDGNYYYIESPLQLADVFHTELQGLMANFGQKVSLGVEPRSGATVAEVLNDLDRNALGRLMLPNLVVGMPIQIVVRLKLPPMPRAAEVGRFRLAWDDPKGGERRSLYAGLTLDSCPSTAWDALPADPEVAEQVAIFMATRAKKEAIAAYDRGDMSMTMGMVGAAMDCLAVLPESSTVAHEREALDQIRADLQKGEGAVFRKRALFQAYRKKHGQDS